MPKFIASLLMLWLLASCSRPASPSLPAGPSDPDVKTSEEWMLSNFLDGMAPAERFRGLYDAGVFRAFLEAATRADRHRVQGRACYRLLFHARRLSARIGRLTPEGPFRLKPQEEARLAALSHRTSRSCDRSQISPRSALE